MPPLSPEFQWFCGIALSVIAFFAIKAWNKLEKIEEHINQLMVKDGIQDEKIRTVQHQVNRLKPASF